MTDINKYVPTPPPAVPRYAVGEQKGDLVVLAYLGYGAMNPVDGRHLQKRHHWYQVQCSCKGREVMNQAQLNTRDKCLECTWDRKGQKISLVQRGLKAVEKESGVPDFASMKLVGGSENE